MSNPLQPDGGDLVGIELDEDGRATNIRDKGDLPSVSDASGLERWQRATSIATQQFFKRKRRLWPRPRT